MRALGLGPEKGALLALLWALVQMQVLFELQLRAVAQVQVQVCQGTAIEAQLAFGLPGTVWLWFVLGLPPECMVPGQLVAQIQFVAVPVPVAGFLAEFAVPLVAALLLLAQMIRLAVGLKSRFQQPVQLQSLRPVKLHHLASLGSRGAQGLPGSPQGHRLATRTEEAFAFGLPGTAARRHWQFQEHPSQLPQAQM